jgi:hypothetical protein
MTSQHIDRGSLIVRVVPASLTNLPVFLTHAQPGAIAAMDRRQHEDDWKAVFPE